MVCSRRLHAFDRHILVDSIASNALRVSKLAAEYLQ